MSDEKITTALAEAAAEAIQDAAVAVHPDTASVEGNPDYMGAAAACAVLDKLADEYERTDDQISHFRLADELRRYADTIRGGR